MPGDYDVASGRASELEDIWKVNTKTPRARRGRAVDPGLGSTDYAGILQKLKDQNTSRMLDILQGFSTGKQWDFFLVINDEELLARMDATIGSNIVWDRTFYAAKREFETLPKKILLKILEMETRGLQDGAFPKEYKTGLQVAISRMPDAKVTGTKPQSVEVTLPDLYVHLGDYGDYEKGFHDQALLAKFQDVTFDRAGRDRPDYMVHPFGDRVRLPWSSGQILKESRAGLRYKAWKALYQGESGYMARRKGGETELGTLSDKEVFIKFPPGASWAATKASRLAAWGGKAPYWLILEFGQPHYEPKVNPQNLNDLAVISSIREKFLVGKETLVGNQFKITDVRFETQVTGVYKRGGRPANISLAWIEACNFAWTWIIQRVWAQQTAAFNRGDVSGVQREATGSGSHGEASGKYNYQSVNSAAGVTASRYGGAQKSTGENFGVWDEHTTEGYIKLVEQQSEDFQSAVDKIMSDFDKFGGY